MKRGPAPWVWLFLLVLAWPLAAQAAVRAWLDRSEVALGGTVTLNVETDRAGPAPDFSALGRDFDVGATRSSRQVSVANGTVNSTSLYGVELTPKRSGELTVPAVAVGGEYTAPLLLKVGAAPPAGSATAGGRVFVETAVDDATPYVQQSVGVVVRLYYATSLASGELDLDAPAGASLQRVGEDRNDVREVNGRRYNVVERRFLLIPERSGSLTVPPARFQGRVAGDPFDDFFGGGAGDGRVAAASAARTLAVKAQPASAPVPWLPLHGLQLGYDGARPDRIAAGQAFTLTVRAVARGAVHSQFPGLPVPKVAGAQVFPEPEQYDERFDAAVPVLTVTRRYAVVPDAPGTLAIPAMALDWWDVDAGQARRATLPAFELAVGPGSAVAGAGPAPAPPAGATAPARDVPARAPPAAASGHRYRWIAAALALLALAACGAGWAWRRRASPTAVPAAGIASPAPAAGELRRALDIGALDEIGHLLRRLAPVPATSAKAVRAQLADPEQQAALDLLERARWRGEDVAAARDRLRRAFAGGPRWRTPATKAARPSRDVLPPLYPRD
jgi:hypothetical protein